MRLIVLAAVLALLGSAAHAQVPTPVDFATVSMTTLGEPRTVTNTICVSDGRDLVCDRDVYIDSFGQVGIGISTPRAELDVPGSIYTDAVTAVSNTLTLNILRTNTYFMGNNGGGRVGINILSGSGANLHVSGTTILSGTAQVRSSLFVNGNGVASTSLHVSGTIRVANGGETCDTNRTGAIRYMGGDFSFCRNGSAWEPLSSLSGGASKLANLTDVSLSNVTGMDILRFNGVSWTNVNVQNAISTTTMRAGWPDAIMCNGYYLYLNSFNINSNGGPAYRITTNTTGDSYVLFD